MAKKRVREIAKHRSFKLSKKKLSQPGPIPGVWRLCKDTIGIIAGNKKLFLGVAAIYAVVSFVFVQGLGSSFQITELKQNIEDIFGTDGNKLDTTVALFGFLIGSAGSNVSEATGVYQFFMIIITSLAAIWAVRQLMAGEKPGLRDLYYRGMYPIIPFMVVLAIVGLQLIPLFAGNLIFSTILQNGLAVTAIEKVLWFTLFLLLALLSFYMLISSLFATYIATLPDVRPIKALRSARELVLHRRWRVGLRIAALPALLGVITVAIFMPLLFVAPQFAEALFLVATSLGIIIFHVYMYVLYRSLL